MNWIAVNARLPDVNEPTQVVGLLNGEVPYVLEYVPGARFILRIVYPQPAAEDVTTVVTHWLPLPPLPQPVVDEPESEDAHLEMIADSILPRFIPDDPSANTLFFEMSAEGQRYGVSYIKDAEGFWKFIKAEVL